MERSAVCSFKCTREIAMSHSKGTRCGSEGATPCREATDVVKEVRTRCSSRGSPAEDGDIHVKVNLLDGSVLG